MPTATRAREEKVPAGKRPHDERTDVKLAGDWLDRWLSDLDHAELRAYLQLAHFYNTRTYHDAATLAKILPGKDTQGAAERLERRGLIEVVRKEGQCHYHFPHRDAEGFHRAERARPSLADALAFQEKMSEELTALTTQDETPALREKTFKKYPQLEEEFDLWSSAADESAPRWRLWMEVSRLLIREFERTYGSLREDHGELFKELSANVLRHHLDVVEGVVHELLERQSELFTEVQPEWVIAPSESEFKALPFVRRLAQRYSIGPEQMFVSTLEALGQQGKIVVSVDERGDLADMVLPDDTGLTKSEERVLFLRPEERNQADSPRNAERVRRARNKHANYLIDRAVGCLADFVAARRVRGIDAWLERVVELVNDRLGLLPMHDGRPVVQLEHIIDRFDALRQGVRPRGRSGAGEGDDGAGDDDAEDESQSDLAAIATTNGRHPPAAPAKAKAAKKKAPKAAKPAKKAKAKGAAKGKGKGKKR